MTYDERKQQKQRVCVVGPPSPHLTLVTRILRAVVVGSVDSGSSIDDFFLDDYDLLVIGDYEGLSGEERERLLALFCGEGYVRRTRLLILCGCGDKAELARLFSQHALTNLLAKNTEVNVAEVIVTVQKILRRDVFGLEKYFPWGIDPITARLCSSEEKAFLLQQMEEYAEELGVNARLVRQFSMVGDELITNALFNAPRDEHGRPRFAHLSRDELVVLEPHEEIEVRYCCDGNRLGISAVDPFGSLTRERLLDYLGRCLRQGADQVEDKPGGAGLGLYYIFEAVSHLVVNIAAGQRTEIIGLIDVQGTYRNFLETNKSFNIFYG